MKYSKILVLWEFYFPQIHLLCVCVCVCGGGIFSHNYTSRELTNGKEQIVCMKTHLFHNYI